MLSWVEHEKSFITLGPDCMYAQAHQTLDQVYMQSCRKCYAPAHLCFCVLQDCMYLHELGEEAASFTKEEMQVG